MTERHSIKQSILQLKKEIGPDRTLVAVSKTKPIEDLREAYEAGQRDFGENKVQELAEKVPLMPEDVRWHFIGHLQRNKVKQVLPFTYLIHSVDSLRLLEEIEKRASNLNKITDVLLQVFIADEETKFGFDEKELMDLINDSTSALPHVRFRGLMGMATNTDDDAQVRGEFRQLKSLFDQCRASGKVGNAFDTLSMGMTGDYKIALEEGSNMVRLGSLIFGERHH